MGRNYNGSNGGGNDGNNGGGYAYRGNTPMFDKLSNVRDRVFTRRPNDGIKDPSPSPMEWVADGVDHINIWDSAETDIGKVLAHDSSISFVHSIFGKFGSMEAFWHYIRSEEHDDRIRTMTGETLKYFAKKLTTARVVNFRAIIADANWQRVSQYKVIADALRESTLPFDCYYINSQSGLRTRPNFFKWLVRGFEEIRNAVKENREPDFTFLLDKPNSGIYDFVIPEYLKNRKPPEPRNNGNHGEERKKKSSLLSNDFANKLQQNIESNDAEAKAASAVPVVVANTDKELPDTTVVNVVETPAETEQPVETIVQATDEGYIIQTPVPDTSASPVFGNNATTYIDTDSNVPQQNEPQ